MPIFNLSIKTKKGSLSDTTEVMSASMIKRREISQVRFVSFATKMRNKVGRDRFYLMKLTMNLIPLTKRLSLTNVMSFSNGDPDMPAETV